MTTIIIVLTAMPTARWSVRRRMKDVTPMPETIPTIWKRKRCQPATDASMPRLPSMVGSQVMMT